ncbi:MAG TPA: aldolase/citrate lyase family protein [Pseudolysinimonas sp.]|nr:aldolase/citrate lyase family protein [Pseudolysinimonas sp.]
MSSAPLLTELRAGRVQLMLGIRSARTTEIVRIAKSTGHACIMIDLEHSAMPIDTAAQLCATANDLGITALVRVPETEYGVIGRLLDGGAHGIIAPRVETADQARRVAEACRFPPEGHRSQLAMLPHFGMTPTPATTMNPELNRHTIVKILIESPLGIANVDQIAGVEGVDIVAFGANDFTSELGIPGQYRDPRVADAVSRLATAARDSGKLAMVGGIPDLELFTELYALGLCPLLLTGMDTDLLFEGARARAERFAAWHEGT